ncbi:Leucine-rich repeat receptor-like protein kinase, partial [Nymphaea thermarum]
EESVYELKVLDDIQSLQLFCWHAFGKEEPEAEIAELSKKVADTAAGLPLALEIFGSHFFGLDTNKEREVMLKKLKKNQNEDIHERLKISFDALDKDEKKVFLDIACFFIGKDRDFATLMWKDISPDLTIKFLMHKSLININERKGEFEMHDHIRDMGRKIVEDENPSDPGTRSRLWKRDDILDVLQNKRGTEKVEAMDISCLSKYLADVDAEPFAGMSQIRMLRLGDVPLTGEYADFPRTLKCLQWSPRYLDALPSTLPLENIVVLDLSQSYITQVWNHHGFREAKVFGQLKVLNLSECWRLTICPDFKRIAYLENLDLSYCWKLIELHPSIGHLKSLTHLCLEGCQSLKELPDGVWQLTSLELLDLSYCSQITTLPSQLLDSKSSKRALLGKLKVMDLSSCNNLTICPDFRCMPYIEELDFSGCKKLSELHPSIGHLKSLTHLFLKECKSLKELPEGVWQLTSLELLDLSYCSQITTLPSQLGNSRQLKQLYLYRTIITALPESMRELKQLNHLALNGCRLLKEIPEWIHSCVSLRKLDLSWTDIKELPCSFTSLEKLECLLVAGCHRLKFLPQLPPSLTILDASWCYELEMIADVSNAEKLQEMNLWGCENLVDVLGIEQLRHLKTLNLERCRSLSVSLCGRVKVINSLFSAFDFGRGVTRVVQLAPSQIKFIISLLHFSGSKLSYFGGLHLLWKHRVAIFWRASPSS